MVTQKRRNKPKRWTTSLEPQTEDVLNAAGAGRLLGVSRRYILQVARTGELPGKKVGREWRFSRAALLAWLAHHDPPA